MGLGLLTGLGSPASLLLFGLSPASGAPPAGASSLLTLGIGFGGIPAVVTGGLLPAASVPPAPLSARLWVRQSGTWQQIRFV